MLSAIDEIRCGTRSSSYHRVGRFLLSVTFYTSKLELFDTFSPHAFGFWAEKSRSQPLSTYGLAIFPGKATRGERQRQNAPSFEDHAQLSPAWSIPLFLTKSKLYTRWCYVFIMICPPGGFSAFEYLENTQSSLNTAWSFSLPTACKICPQFPSTSNSSSIQSTVTRSTPPPAAQQSRKATGIDGLAKLRGHGRERRGIRWVRRRGKQWRTTSRDGVYIARY